MNIGLEQIFFYRRDKKGQQVNENVLNITNIRKMQIKMTMNVHHKKSKWKGCGEKATFICCWWKYKLVQAQQKAAWRFLNKQTSKKTQQNYNMIQKFYFQVFIQKILHQDLKRDLYSCIHCSYSQQQRLRSNLNVHQWIKDKENMVYTYHGIFLS